MQILASDEVDERKNSLHPHQISGQIYRFLSKFALISILICALALKYAELIGNALAPIFHSEIQLLDDTYRVDGLSVDQEGGDPVLRLRAGQAHYIILNGQAFPPDPRGKADASTLLGNIVLPAGLMLAIVLAWPTTRAITYLSRLALVVPAIGLLWAIDVPMILWGGIWSLHVDAFAPDLFSPLLLWCKFLQGGGRQILAVSLALLVISTSRPNTSVR